MLAQEFRTTHFRHGADQIRLHSTCKYQLGKGSSIALQAEAHIAHEMLSGLFIHSFLCFMREMRPFDQVLSPNAHNNNSLQVCPPMLVTY